jgi:hypothetical protein
MHTKIRSTTITLGALAFMASSIIALPAMADNTWISGPSLANVSIVAPAATTLSSGFSLSTQSSEFTLSYHGSSNDAGKFAQVNFFDISSGLNVALASSPVASSTGCDQQVLGGNNHSCMFKLDGTGSASIRATLSGVSTSGSLKYILLSGPNITQTASANITFAAPKTIVKAAVATVKAMAGGAAVVRFKLLDGQTAAASIRLAVAVTGVKDHLSATSVTSDAQGYVWVYVANLKKKLGTTKITVTIDGTSTKASASIKWVKGTLAK